MTRLPPHRASTNTNCSAGGHRESEPANETDLLLLEELHARLPIGLLVYDADTLEILHSRPPLPGVVDRDLPFDLSAVVEEVASTGRPQHLPEFRHHSPGEEPNWWSATVHRLDTDRWGHVVLTLTVDITDQVHARQFHEDRERRHLDLQQTIAGIPGDNLVVALHQVADALLPALEADAATLRLLDTEGRLHLVAANGLRRAETRRLALDSITVRRLEKAIEANRYRRPGSIGLHWIEPRWLGSQDNRIGILITGGRSKRPPSAEHLRLLDAVAAELGIALKKIDRSPQFLRGRSLQVAARLNEAVSEIEKDPRGDLRPRELAILRLYDEGLRTDQIAELLVLSPHTVRTHVRNARRHLSVNSRAEALEVLKAAYADPFI